MSPTHPGSDQQHPAPPDQDSDLPSNPIAAAPDSSAAGREARVDQVPAAGQVATQRTRPGAAGPDTTAQRTEPAATAPDGTAAHANSHDVQSTAAGSSEQPRSVPGDSASSVAGDHTLSVAGDHTSSVAGDHTSSVAGERASSVAAASGEIGGGRRWSRTAVFFAAALAGLIVLALISAAVGQVPTTPGEVAGAFFHRIGLDWGPMPHHPAGYVTLWEVRFPRVVLAILVGAALATAGALLQGVFANPLAEPGVIGVSAGAAVGAGAVIVVGGAFVAAWSVAAGAFVAGLGTTLLVYLLARSGGRTEVVTLVLTGVAINAFAGGLMSFLLFTASPAARDQIVFWQLGSLNGATWQSVYVVAPLTFIGVVAAIFMAPKLDLLALGESAARHLGVDVERLRRNVIVVVAVLATAGVAFTGIVLFVGLIVPHLVRMMVGPAHRVLIPLSAIVGAVVLLAADIGARALVHNADLPLGMLTSLVGGPFFFWLLRRTRARSGGWA